MLLHGVTITCEYFVDHTCMLTLFLSLDLTAGALRVSLLPQMLVNLIGYRRKFQEMHEVLPESEMRRAVAASAQAYRNSAVELSFKSTSNPNSRSALSLGAREESIGQPAKDCLYMTNIQTRRH